MTKMINTPAHAQNISEYIVKLDITNGQYLIAGYKKFEEDKQIIYELTPAQFTEAANGSMRFLGAILDELNAPKQLTTVVVVNHMNEFAMFGFADMDETIGVIIIDGVEVDDFGLIDGSDVMELSPEKIISTIRNNPHGIEKPTLH